VIVEKDMARCLQSLRTTVSSTLQPLRGESAEEALDNVAHLLDESVDRSRS